MDAINTLQAIELEGRAATVEEQKILSNYVGWGSLPDAFDPDKPEWADEFLELQAALTPQEYEAARQGGTHVCRSGAGKRRRHQQEAKPAAVLKKNA